MRHASITLCLLVMAGGGSLFAQPKAGLRTPAPVDPVAAAEQGRALVADLLAQQPAQAVTNTGRVIIRDAQDRERQVPVLFSIAPGASNIVSLYQTTGANKAAQETLRVCQPPAGPILYELTDASGTRALTGNQTMIPFAGSDFWVADLGLEFLRWPAQRLLRKEMRRSQFCDVLESVNPQPAPSAYKRVVSWIAANRDGIVIVQARAYDAADKLLKEFEPRKLERVQGGWTLQSMEMSNRQTESRTLIEFDLSKEP